MPLPTQRRRRRLDKTRSAGQALVEFTLVVPILLLLLVSIADFARIYTTSITVESAGREAAMAGAYLSSYWNVANLTSSPNTVERMEGRACTAASTLPDYQGAAANGQGVHPTCSNPQLVDLANNPITAAQITSQLKASDAGILQKPGIADCQSPPVNSTCTVHVRLRYQFRMLLGGIGIPGLYQFPATFDFTRDVYYPVNAFVQ